MNIDKEFIILQPKYYRKFQCDPIKCRETCCERWKIIVDKSTYKKYIHSDNAAIKEIAKTGLSINELTSNDDDFGIINLNNEMVCPFLDEKNLCQIVMNMGDSSLSKTCKSYPRAIILAKDIIERGLETSCSVAAEGILLKENGIEFEYIKETVKINELYINSPTIKDLKQIEIVKEIKTTIIELLQTRGIELSERVEIAGYFLNQILDGINCSNFHHEEILSKIKETKSLIRVEKYKITKRNYKSENRQQFDYLNTILSMKFKEGDSISFFSKRYIECLMEVLDAFGNVKDKDLEKNYKRNYVKYLKPYLDEKPYILENFLVNYVFVYGSQLFRFSEIWTFYLKLCVVYGLIKFNLVGLATYNKGINDDLVLKLIQSLSKTIIPDRTYLESVIKYLEEQKLDGFPEVLALIMD